MRALVLVAACIAVLGCAPSYQGIDPASGAQVTVKGRELCSPIFDGEWDSPQLGHLTVNAKDDDSVSGTFAFDHGDPACPVSGSLLGVCSGTLLTISWAENWSRCGRPAEVRGCGFLVYHPAAHPELLGSWGYWDNDRLGGQWLATKETPH